MSKQNIGAILLVLVTIAGGAAVATLLPLGAKVNDIGYNSWCPFAPWSTLMLSALAGVIWVIRQYVLTRVK
jgi:hypothetical protein